MRILRSRDEIFEINRRTRRDQDEFVQNWDNIAMIDLKKSEACLRISRILQFLQTIHQKFRENSQALDQIDQKKRFIRVKWSMQDRIRTSKTNDNWSARLSTFWSRQANLYRKWFIKLCQCRNSVSNERERWIAFNNFFFKKSCLSEMQLRNIRQKTFSHNQMLWTMKTRIDVNRTRRINESAYRSQESWVFYVHQAA
jgi:hypothetical protein